MIWHKPNCQPESVKDRPTRAHEYVFLLSKSKDYFYDAAAIEEPTKGGTTRNRRSVWTLHTEPLAEAHFAAFPPRLVEPCVLAGSPSGSFVLDPFFGSGTVGVVCRKLQRHFVGIEIKPEYIAIAERRLSGEAECPTTQRKSLLF